MSYAEASFGLNLSYLPTYLLSRPNAAPAALALVIALLEETAPAHAQPLLLPLLLLLLPLLLLPLSSSSSSSSSSSVLFWFLER